MGFCGRGFDRFGNALFCALVLMSVAARGVAADAPVAQQWVATELTFTAERDYANPYTDVQMHADFQGDGGVMVRRPAFWDGGRTWRVRFAPPSAARGIGARRLRRRAMRVSMRRREV